ncbi:MAG TPA: translocation/assembly module TamB domain-containing protein [Candidatus Bathyarchaeia archaeon]|nr:translocation/assembly module TamB domain-containing protein [Candidatus Bathyarchaeia archaeon]
MRKRVVMIVLGILFAAAGAVFFFFNTPQGAKVFFRRFLHGYFHPQEVALTTGQTDVFNGTVFENIELVDVAWLPVPNRVRVQKAYMKIKGWGPDGIVFDIENARLLLPNLEPVVIFAKMDKGYLEANIFVQSVGLQELRDWGLPIPSEIKGGFDRVDIYAQGPLEELRVFGEVFVEKMERQDFLLKESQGSFDFKVGVKDFQPQWVEGRVGLTGGIVRGKRTAVIELRQGSMVFDRDGREPVFNVRAASQVGDVKIRIYLQGSWENPDLALRSEPSFSQGRLLAMLATNTKWESAESGFQEQKFSPDLVKEFLDYLLGGYDGQIISPLVAWVRGLSLQYDEQGRPVGFRSEILDRVQAGYRVDREASTEEKSSYTVSGGFKITDRLFVEGEKQFFSPASSGENSDFSQEGEGRLLFKIKQKF